MAAKKKSDRKKVSARAKLAELRAQSVEQLQNELSTKREELMRARFRHATATQEDTAALRTMRRQIARISTILQEKGQRA